MNPKCQNFYDHIIELLTTPVLHMLTSNTKLILELDTSKSSARAGLFQFQHSQQIIVRYYSKKLPQAVQNYGITALELTGLLCNIHASASC